jgi:hypothetical protein
MEYRNSDSVSTALNPAALKGPPFTAAFFQSALPNRRQAPQRPAPSRPITFGLSLISLGLRQSHRHSGFVITLLTIGLIC